MERCSPRPGEDRLRPNAGIERGEQRPYDRFPTKSPDPAGVTNWNLVDFNYQFQAPAPANFLVTVASQPVVVQSVLGFKRR